jgi:phthiodiolone/phenolphthiodiolone dimycocerosates ketoreductase
MIKNPRAIQIMFLSINIIINMGEDSPKFGCQHGLNTSMLRYTVEDILRSAILADYHGFDSVWIMDHTNSPPADSEVYEAWTMLGAIAMKTKNVRIGTMVSDVLRKNPAVIAESLLTLNKLSKGRACLGIGAGEGMNLTQFGVDWDRPASRMEEGVIVIKKLLKATPEDPADYKGTFFELKEAFLQLKSEPTPPIWIAANGRRTREIAGRFGDGWIPTAISPKNYAKYVKEVEKAAKEAGREAEEIEKGCEIFLPKRTPEEWIDSLDKYVKVGVEHFAIEFMGEYEESMKLFSREVIPCFKE